MQVLIGSSVATSDWLRMSIDIGQLVTVFAFEPLDISTLFLGWSSFSTEYWWCDRLDLSGEIFPSPCRSVGFGVELLRFLRGSPSL